MPHNESENVKPRYIYKYVSYEIAKVILSENTLKFSPPSSFNDPYDCDVELLDFKFDGTIDDSIIYEMRILKEIFKGKVNLNSKSNFYWEKVYKGAQLQKINSTKISCFSLLSDNLLMWSHYGDKHNGVCLGFNNLLEGRFVNLIDELHVTEGIVAYDSKERINYIAEDRRFAIAKLFFTKAEEWSYEKEYRFILLNQEKECYIFRPDFLTSVYFGINVAPAKKIEIVDLCTKLALDHVCFFEGSKSNRTVIFSPFTITGSPL